MDIVAPFLNGLREPALHLVRILLVMSAAGCMVYTVKETPPRKGPVPEVGYIDKGSGEIKYSPEGWSWIIKWRRRRALKKIGKLCQGLDYKITDEYAWEDVETPYGKMDIDEHMGKGMKHYNVDTYIHIEYECQPPESGK